MTIPLKRIAQMWSDFEKDGLVSLENAQEPELARIAAMIRGMGDAWRHRDNTARGFCPYGLCGGVGWMRHDVPVGHALFGKVEICACLKEKQARAGAARVEEMKQQLSSTEQGYTLQNWKGTDADALKQARRAVKSLSKIWTFYGAVGVGKSGLLTAIANSILELGLPVIYKVVPKLLQELRPGGGADANLLDQICNVRVLILDDLWRAKESEWTADTMFTIIDYRYRFSEEKLTVIATNAKPDKGEDAISSRLCDTERAVLVPVFGNDLRPIAKTMRQPSSITIDRDALGK